MDFDSVILNGTILRAMQAKSELVIGKDNNDCTRTCAGFFSCVPNSLLMKKWLSGYENNYLPKDWIHNAGECVCGIAYVHACVCECVCVCVCVCVLCIIMPRGVAARGIR